MTIIDKKIEHTISSYAKQKTFLFVTVPVTGHVSPLLPIAKELVQRGHEVLWYTGAHFKQRIEARGVRFVPSLRSINRVLR